MSLSVEELMISRYKVKLTERPTIVKARCGCYPFVKSISEFKEMVNDLLYVPYGNKIQLIKNQQQNKE